MKTISFLKKTKKRILFQKGIFFGVALLLCLNLISGSQAVQAKPVKGPMSDGGINPPPGQPNSYALFLPVLLNPAGIKVNVDAPTVHIPYFNSDIIAGESAIFWFGKVNLTENYADVRVGYNADYLFVEMAAFDRLLWYDPSPTPSQLNLWDAVTLYLNQDGNNGDKPGVHAYKFVGMLDWWETDRTNFQAAYQGNGSSWTVSTIPFTTKAGWRGNAPEDMTNDDGWTEIFHIPFTSLGLSGPPSPGSVWGLAMSLHDRDDAAGTPIPDEYWPSGMNANQPVTWGRMSFGLPVYNPPPSTPGSIVTIRQGLNGMTVKDGEVGGGAICGEGLDRWTQWGDTSLPGSEANADLNIQSQVDMADFPCYSKYYVTFPLTPLPADKVIISATLTLYQFGNSGGGQWGDPPTSLIQIFTSSGDWQESTLTWNNAPQAWENIGRSWVYPITTFPGWPGVANSWDVSLAVAQAYADGQQPVQLILYSADEPRHTGKYFTSSETAEWDATGRPTLTVQWGTP